MTKDEILERLQTLQEQRDNAYAQYQALTGAVQDCEWFLMRHEQENDNAPNDLSDQG